MSSELLVHSPLLSKPLYCQAYRPSHWYFERSKNPALCAALGSRPRSRTLYDLLELSPDVGTSDIKHAYRQLARKYHPDVCPSHLAEESARRFIEIQEAYETLSDPRLRAIYDHAAAMGRGSASTGRMPWMPSKEKNEPIHWKSQWEGQLSELRRRNHMKARRADSWSARVRRENGLEDV